ncbi:telomere-protecting terminal protein Tpg [Streptacidiphilus cavernicola]|uniref:XRE family transcriptional regulator n=1 Tax=Streptacidiphilus cavernicola TaxID=3342716 RepID=A0ABV6VQ39_9ACTN
MGTISDSLDRAAEERFTRKPPVGTAPRVAFLVRRLGSTRAVAELLGVSQRSVERYLKGTRKHPPTPIAARIEAELKRRWQPLVRKRATDRAVSTGGITVETRAQFGFSAAPGSTDDPRLRRITQHLPPDYARRLFDAHAAGATEQQLSQVIAQGLGEVYFKEGGRRADGLTVELNAIDYLDLDY